LTYPVLADELKAVADGSKPRGRGLTYPVLADELKADELKAVADDPEILEDG
jgi:hypothetical protein